MYFAESQAFSRAANDVGTWLAALVFMEETRARTRAFASHALYLNAVLRCGQPGSGLLLHALSAAQVCTCATLVVPPLYARLGTCVPSAALAGTLLVEMLLYDGFRSAEPTCKCALLLLVLGLVALTRGDTKARRSQRTWGLPIGSAALAAEARVRRTCTRARAALVCTPLAAASAALAVARYSFWRHAGTVAELKRTSFLVCVALCALLSIVAGQDRSPALECWALARHAIAKRARAGVERACTHAERVRSRLERARLRLERASRAHARFRPFAARRPFDHAAPVAAARTCRGQTTAKTEKHL